MNDLQRYSFRMFWRGGLFLLLVILWGLADAQPALTLCGTIGMIWLVWAFRKDWRARRGR